jgi:PPOX class probable F420-dependent enzyme
MARTDISMSDDELQALFSEVSVLQVATVGRDGWPHVAPMWFVVDEERLVFRSFSKSQKIVNLQRDRRLTVLLEAGDSYDELRGAMIKGSARLVDDPAYVLDVYGRLAARYPMVGPEPVELDEAAREAAFGRFAMKNTAVVVEPRSIASWDHRKLGGAY